MSLNEMLDIFDEQMVKIGTASRQETHARGLWHQTFQCWIVSQSAKEGWNLLFQLRHRDKDTFPNLLDISCAGHLLAGETVEDGVRELEEELGLSVSFDDLLYCGIVAQETTYSADMADREFNHVFLYDSDKPLNKYRFQRSEISGLFLVDSMEYKQLLLGEKEWVPSEGIIVTDSEDDPVPVKRNLCRQDFTPNSHEYYELLFAELNRMIERR